MPTVNFGSFSKRRNSTKQPILLPDQRTVQLKETTSVDHPTFIISGNNFGYNYCSWDNRYYFITDIRSVHNGLTEIDCVLDVLATYKSNILASTQFVSYSSQLGNAWLADTRIPVLKSTQASKNVSNVSVLSTIGCYILSVVGKESAASYVFQSDGTIKDIIQEISNWNDDGITDIINDDMNLGYDFSSVENALESLGKMSIQTGFVGNAYSQAPSCIRSCIWVPFDYALAPISASDAIFLGNFDTNESGQRVSGRTVTGSNTVSIPWHFADWRRGYCEDVYLYLPLVGMIALSADSLTGVSSLTVDWSVTYTDGCIAYEVKAGNQIIGTYGGNCCANYPIGINQQASAGEIAQTFMAGLEKVISAGVNSSISPVSAAASVGGMVAEGAIGAYNVQSVASSSHASSVGGIGGGAGSGLDMSIACYTVAHNTAVNPADMKDTMGLPTMKPMQLATLTGFCQCANAHVEAAAMSQELDAIDYYLNSGFFIE
jgi:hypothetical protein